MTELNHKTLCQQVGKSKKFWSSHNSHSQLISKKTERTYDQRDDQRDESYVNTAGGYGVVPVTQHLNNDLKRKITPRCGDKRSKQK
jgi:hypothetical protein